MTGSFSFSKITVCSNCIPRVHHSATLVFCLPVLFFHVRLRIVLHIKLKQLNGIQTITIFRTKGWLAGGANLRAAKKENRNFYQHFLALKKGRETFPRPESYNCQKYHLKISLPIFADIFTQVFILKSRFCSFQLVLFSAMYVILILN